MDYVFMTDSDSDLPLEFQEKYNVPVIYMPYTLDGQEYYDDLGRTFDYKHYYTRMREGAVARTSALNKDNYIEYFEPVLREKDLLLISFSSKMSNTLEAARAAIAELTEKYPGRRVRIVDTLSISCPMAVVVMKAYELYLAGKSMDEVGDWVEANRFRGQAYIAVENLRYLQRGGRLSPTAAFFGNMLNLKPIIVEGRDGLMKSIDKVRGRKQAIRYIVDHSVAAIEDPKESVCVILHADCIEDAEIVHDEMREKVPGLELIIRHVGPVIGAHCGPGTLAVCFMGRERQD